MKLRRPLVIMDLETTGTWVEKDRIIEIAMVRLDEGRKTVYESRVNPGMEIPQIVQELTGISNRDVADAPVFKTIAKDVLDFIGDADLGGYNVDRFDLPLLEREVYEAGLRFEWRGRNIFDAQKAYHYHEKRDLTAAYQFYCGKKLVNAHSALGDTEATLEILQSQVTKYANGEGIDALKAFENRGKTDFFDSGRRFRWWNGELYPMFGKYARKNSLKVIVRKDPGYLEWILKQDFAQEVKDMVRGALEGKFPERTS